ncbi:MAG: zinc-ribbon domain-containing protein [Oscillospiraceae bacterium]|nr:zinc-ribbon domain-containing protein [Oscillospiraceae bacterium]
MTLCQNCGAPLEPGASACPRCGKPAANALPQPVYPYPYPVYPAYPQRPALPVTNTCAILGFVMAWLPIPLAWLVLSIVGLVQCSQNDQKGKGLAIAGILLRVLGLAALIGGAALLVRHANTGMYFPDFWDWEEEFAFTVLR